MKTIVCTGDSHTWGQGIPGLEGTFSPPVTAGDLRLVSFKYNSYVNFFRRLVSQKTGSSAVEFEAQSLQHLPDSGKSDIKNGCALINDIPVNITADMGLVRIQFLSGTEPSGAIILLDGKTQREIDLRTDNPVNGYRTVSFFCNPDDKHTLTIKALWGVVQLYRIEIYSGEVAVLNSGVGSCTVSKFLSEYWDNYVQVFHPYAAALEPHTINDWLTGETPAEYHRHLRALANKFRTSGCEAVMMTVSPILGSQDIPFNKISYPSYIEESRRVAVECGISLCDTNAVMGIRLKGLTDEKARSLLFNDNWHVNELGHRIYAEALYDEFIRNGLI